MGIRASAVGVAPVVVFILAHGCGGSAFTTAPPSSDAGTPPADAAAADAAPPEGGTTSDGAIPPPAMCVLPPNGVGDEGPFCSFQAAVLSNCGECEACEQEDVNDCVPLGDTLSAAFKSALGTCANELSCGNVSSYAGDPCVRAQLDKATPTPAQAAVKAAYCADCPNDTEECTGFFDLSKDGGPSGLGAFALVVSDAIAQQIAANCSSAGTAAKCDPTNYGLCSGLVFCNAAPHGHCAMGLCD